MKFNRKGTPHLCHFGAMPQDRYRVVVVQPMPGPQVGVGNPEVAERWLTTACLGVEETEAAVTPATTTQKAKTRNASFIISYPLQRFLTKNVFALTLLW
jgi:hypothetical protein